MNFLIHLLMFLNVYRSLVIYLIHPCKIYSPSSVYINLAIIYENFSLPLFRPMKILTLI